MLRIWQMSGQELPAVSMAQISHVRDLKESLRRQHGFPMCMQQLLHKGTSLDNSTELDAPIDLQLVLIPLSTHKLQLEAAKELAEACKQGDLKTTRLLLEAGAKQDQLQNYSDNTALMLAAENGHVEIARLLLDAGADKNLQNERDSTALMLAARNGHVEIARQLLKAGADIDQREFGDGYTALFFAAESGHVEIVQLLLEAGANKDLRGRGCSALTLAEQRGHGDVAKLLRVKARKITKRSARAA